MVDGTGTSTYTYNTKKQLTSVTDGTGNAVGYGYDDAGRINAITYPDGHQVTRTYDDAGQLATVTDWNQHTTSFGYDGDGNLTTTTYPNGITETATVNTADQTTGIDITMTGDTSLATFGYTYTPGGQVVSTTDSLAPTSTNTYTYTANRQLAGHNANPVAYSYDGTGNITALDAGNALSYDASGRVLVNQPDSGSTTTYSYDADGNRTSAANSVDTATYGYDEANRLTTYTAFSDAVQLQYDGDGLRTGSTSSREGNFAFVWDEATSSLPLVLSDGATDYLYGPGGQVIEQIDQDGTPTYLHHDRIGSVRLLTDSAGATTATASYDAYGIQIGADGAEYSRFGYAGEYTDVNGLVYLRARYYDPSTAAFITTDPAYDTTRSWYGYAGGDPLDAVDPSGRHLCDPDLDGRCGAGYYNPPGSAGAPSDGCGNGAFGPVCAPPPRSTPPPVDSTSGGGAEPKEPGSTHAPCPLLSGPVTIEDPVPVELTFPSTYWDVHLEASSSLTLTDGRGALAPSFAPGGKSVGINYTDTVGEQIRLKHLFNEDKTSVTVSGAPLGFSVGQVKVTLSAGATFPELGFGELEGTVKTEMEVDGMHHAELEDEVTISLEQKEEVTVPQGTKLPTYADEPTFLGELDVALYKWNITYV